MRTELHMLSAVAAAERRMQAQSHSVIIYPAAAVRAGNHAEALADHYGCTTIHHDWVRPRNGDVPRNALLLTSERPPGTFGTVVEIVRYEDALTAITDLIAEGM